MNNKPTTPQTLQEQLRELEEEVEKKKVKLTPEIQQYIREHLEAVQEKLVNSEPVFEEDMEFMNKVKMWVGLPEELREKYPSIKEMMGSEEMESLSRLKNLSLKDFEDASKEAKERDISLMQWLALLHAAKASGGIRYEGMREVKLKTEEWISAVFDFPGRKKIRATKYLDLDDCEELVTLPDGLKVEGRLSLSSCLGLIELPEGLDIEKYLLLKGCTGLVDLPKKLKIKENLYLENCTGLIQNKTKVLPPLFEKMNKEEIGGISLSGWPLEDNDLPKGLNVRDYLGLSNCTGLAKLPDGLEVKGYLNLEGCTGLKELVEGLKVGWSFNLTGCTGLTELPEKLEVKGVLRIDGCTGLIQNKTKILPVLFEKINDGEIYGVELSEWPLEDSDLPEKLKTEGNFGLRDCKELTKLPDSLDVGGDLQLSRCTGLTKLPKELKVGSHLLIQNCTGLTKLPEGLSVEEDIYLSEDLHEQVKKDAERLIKEGKIKGKIEYS